MIVQLKLCILPVSDNMPPKEGSNLHNDLLVLHCCAVLNVERYNLTSLWRLQRCFLGQQERVYVYSFP